jgi:ankyrin repeat protein
MSKTHSNDNAPRSAVHFGFQILTTVAVIVAVALPLGCGDGSPSNPSPSSAALKTNTNTSPPDETASPSTETIDIWTPAAMGEIATLKARLKKAGDPNALDPTFGVSALEIAADFGHVDAMKAILEAGGIVDVRSRARGTALIGAAFLGRPECVTFLLEAGADPTAMNNDQITALTALDVPWEFTQPIIEMLQMPIDREVLEAGRNACRPILEAALK